MSETDEDLKTLAELISESRIAFLVFYNKVKRTKQPGGIKYNINNLRNAWIKRNKSLEDYYDMKEFHSEINGHDFKNEAINRLWDNYTTKSMRMRLNVTRILTMANFNSIIA